jgi:hypothetical protein
MYGKPQYIMTIPERNHNVKSRLSATPIQRWRKMAERSSAAVGRIITVFVVRNG